MNHQETLSRLIDKSLTNLASDLHLSEGRVPHIRAEGRVLTTMSDEDHAFSKKDMEEFLKLFLPQERLDVFAKNSEVDFSFTIPEKDIRFRGNAYIQQDKICIALRFIPSDIKTLEELNLPPTLDQFIKKKQGFFLVAGPTGHGKSTTLASMVEMINQERPDHIITIEDPIEYVFKPKKALIDQREVRSDTTDFASGLRSMFRQDGDVLMVGEMRGPETMAAAVTAAETGHLVFSTLHTNTSAQTIDRIIDSFESNQQDQIRVQLAGSLTGILSQRLIPRVSGGLIPAYELLIGNSAVANLIREKRTHEINTVIETSSQEGMISLNKSLAYLVQTGEITVDNAFAYSANPKTLEQML